MNHSNPITIIYASASGNVELVVDHVAEILKAHTPPFAVNKLRAETTHINTIMENDIFVFATSTWEHGEINPYFNNLLKEMSNLDFTSKKAAFIGLGDKRYEPVLFCEGIEILKRAFKKHKGQEIYQTLKIDGEPRRVIDSDVKTWTFGLISELLHL